MLWVTLSSSSTSRSSPALSSSSPVWLASRSYRQADSQLTELPTAQASLATCYSRTAANAGLLAQCPALLTSPSALQVFDVVLPSVINVQPVRVPILTLPAQFVAQDIHLVYKQCDAVAFPAAIAQMQSIASQYTYNSSETPQV